jgi:hypothetical protein
MLDFGIHFTFMIFLFLLLPSLENARMKGVLLAFLSVPDEGIIRRPQRHT